MAVEKIQIESFLRLEVLVDSRRMEEINLASPINFTIMAESHYSTILEIESGIYLEEN